MTVLTYWYSPVAWRDSVVKGLFLRRHLPAQQEYTGATRTEDGVMRTKKFSLLIEQNCLYRWVG